MENIVIYDSFFGNTEKIANRIASKLNIHEKTKSVNVKKLTSDQLANAKLLIIGSPTRKFSPASSIKKFLKRIPKGGLEGLKVAAFDTRIASEDTNSKILNFLIKIFGYAAKPMTKKLQKKGGDLLIGPEGFYVTGTKGPLKRGELERAEEWAESFYELYDESL